jgi:integrase
MTKKMANNRRSKAVVASPTPLLALADLTQTWEGHRADHFSEALMAFIGSQTSQNTRRSYEFAIRQFWQWFIARTGRCPVPAEISRTEATAYAAWLRKQSDEAVELQLLGRGDMLGLAIYRSVRSTPGCRIDEIRQLLAKQSINIGASDQELDRLDRALAKLVRQGLLRRQPSFKQACEQDKDKGADVDIDYRPDPGVFRYTVAPLSKLSPSTIAQRLGTLASLWEYLRDTGENVDGGRQALLQHNIWAKLARKAKAPVASHKKASRAVSTPSLELFIKVLATTFRRSHEDPVGAADLTVRKGTFTAGTAPATIYDLRDRALLLLLLFTGMRAEEAGSIRQKHLGEEDSDGILTFTGKGGRTRLLSVPGPALAAVREFGRRLIALAETARQNERSSPRTRVLDHPDAPLLPGIKQWGNNASKKRIEPSEIRGLSQSGITKMIRRRARAAGIKPGSSDWKKLGVHGIRHLAAHYALDRGVPLPIVQEVLGHTSLATTGLYVEQRDPGSLTLWPE